MFTQNLSLFAKLFLDTKSVFFDVTTFIYYILYYTPKPQPHMTTNGLAPSPEQPRVVGYFSKEKLSWDSNNLACICVFPPWQKQGFGQVLMAASYQLSMWEGKQGGPEKRKLFQIKQQQD
jgi:MOZ/SAS family